MKKVIQKRRRLMEAMQANEFAENAETPEEMQKQLKMLYECVELHPQTKMLNYKLCHTKMRILENWEITKKRAVERLSEEIEELQILQQNIERREYELEQLGIDVDDPSSLNIFTTGNENALNLTKAELEIQQPLHRSTPIQNPPKKQRILPKILEDINTPTIKDSDLIVIGPNGTAISKGALKSINWSLSGAAITRKILMEVFDRETLAFHTLTGKPSPAFMGCHKPSKKPLDAAKVADIIHIITTNLQMTPKEVRSAITTKCADENKMYRQRMKRQTRK